MTEQEGKKGTGFGVSTSSKAPSTHIIGSRKPTFERPPAPVMGHDPDVPEDEQGVPPKTIYTIAGEKGSGKTTHVLMAPGSKLIITYDDKISRNLEELRQLGIKFPKVDIVSALQFFSGPMDNMQEESMKGHFYALEVLNTIDINQYDWIVFDGMRKMSEMAEQVVRATWSVFHPKKSNYGPYQPVGEKNFDFWKMRNQFIKEPIGIAKKKARMGLMFTTFTRVEETIRNGKIVETSRPKPKWSDIFMEQTDVTLIILVDKKLNDLKRYILIDNSKIAQFPTFKSYDMMTLEQAQDFWLKLYTEDYIKRFGA